MRQELVPLTEARGRLNELVRTVLPARNVTLLRHGRPVAILIDPERFESLISRIEDLEDTIAALEHRAAPDSVPFNVQPDKAVGAKG